MLYLVTKEIALLAL